MENEKMLKASFPKAGFSLIEGLNSLKSYNEIWILSRKIAKRIFIINRQVET